MSVLYHPRKENVVVDALSGLSTGSVAHIEEEKKELVRDVHRLVRLGVQLVDSTKGGFMVHNGSESCFVVDVNQSKDTAGFVAKCLNCQQVKVEHQKLGGFSQDISIPTWKWEYSNMDFIVGLPRTRQQHYSIWVIVDRMTKLAHFLRIKVSYSMEDYS
ncbi:hypothetical protein MTR67_043594 [Solanum verrucosum]|uniref:Uncharacterized protein n=1 Tax=Solanum verrucosum TaxID=315347 RepID=A0AAF0ZVA5_SOLVR|nr:hypothetical protein MTR67_043594 [Solanum verrucosum]